MIIEYCCQEKDDGQKLQDILKKEFAFSSQLIRRIKNNGICMANQKAKRMIDELKKGDMLKIVWDIGKDAFALTFKKDEALKYGIKIIYQDEYLLLVEKPADMVTHPCYLHQKKALTLNLQTCIDTENTVINIHPALHPVSRLDRDTSGLVIIAKAGFIQDVISKNKIEKKYLALCHGCFSSNLPLQGDIIKPIARDPDSIILRTVDEYNGKFAHTSYKVIQEFHKANLTLVEFTLHTGRTHQLRLHSLSIGHPIVGEGLYGLERLYDKKIWLNFLNKYQLKNRSFIDESHSNYMGSYVLPSKWQGDLQILNKLDTDSAFHWQSKIQRQALHAYAISFFHPVKKTIYSFKTELPHDILNLVNEAWTLE